MDWDKLNPIANDSESLEPETEGEDETVDVNFGKKFRSNAIHS